MDKITLLTSWWGGGQSSPSTAECTPQDGAGLEKNKETTGTSDDTVTTEPPEISLDDELNKAINSAKDWGNYLYSFASTATKKVSATASKVKEQFEENTLLGDFSREQERFAHEQRWGNGEDPVAPWVGYGEEETKMKEQMLALSTDRRNFLRNPPLGVDFHFDYETCFIVALATLEVDANLKAMRFELVPKNISEEMFWRNYFYRVSLIKQSSQLTTITLKSANGEPLRKEKSQEDLSNRVEDKLQPPIDIPVKPADQVSCDDDNHRDNSPPSAEFASDAFAGSELDVDDVRRDMEQLGMDDKPSTSPGEDILLPDVPEWEVELQQELQEYEVVDEDHSDPAWEQEIQKMLEAEEGELGPTTDPTPR